MAKLCVRLLRRYRSLPGVTKRGFPASSAHQVTPATFIVRPASSYFKSVFPVNQQTLVEPGPDRVRLIRRNEEQYLPTQQFNDVTTLYDGFQRGKRNSNDGNFLGWRSGPDQPFQWISYSQTEERSRLFGSGLISLGIRPGRESCIGIFSQNRPEWFIADLACIFYSMVSVPLYNSLGVEAIRHIINQTNMSILVCDTLTKAEVLLQDSASMPNLKVVVAMNVPSEGLGELQQKFEAEGLKLMSFDDVIAKGIKHLSDVVLPKPSDLNTIVYTSGTTGVPKGVPLTHQNHIINHAYVHSSFDVSVFAKPEDVHLSYLPLPHVFERANMYHCMMHGSQAGFFQGDPLKLIDDVQTLKPMFFFGVPRIFNRVYDEIMMNVSSSSYVKRAIFNFAYQQKLKDLQRGIIRKDTIWDRLVFKKIQDILGGRIKFFLSGAAPISPKVVTFYQVVMGCTFYEGYGQTETTSCISHTIETDTTAGHVGIPGGNSQIKLVDVPDLNYFSSDDKGEICVKGGNIFAGYFKDPEKTKEVLDKDGWLHTGDIGQWNQNGTLSVIDRKKHILKLAQGLYVAPEKVENVYIRHPLLVQIFVYGDSVKSSVVGVVIPEPQELDKFAKQMGIEGTLHELCQNEKLNAAVLKALQKHGKEDGLHGFEQVQGIYIHPEPFSEQNGLLTPTLKTKRPELAKVFQQQVQNMYRALE